MTRKSYKPRNLRNRQITAVLKKRPDLNYKEIGVSFGVSEFLVGAVALRAGLQHGRFGRPHFRVSSILQATAIPKHVESSRHRRAMLEKKIVAFVQRHPEMTYVEVAKAFDVKTFLIANLMYKHGICRSRVSAQDMADKVRLLKHIRTHPMDSYSDMSRATGFPTRYLALIAREAGLFRGKGQGPRHNQGRPPALSTREHMSQIQLAQRDLFRDAMLKVWDQAGDRYRAKMGQIMKRRWTLAARKEMSRALQLMWRASRAKA